MQQTPTLTGVRLRTIQDALKVFRAVHLKILPMITRRLDFDERRDIKQGNLYVWEERNPVTHNIGLGIERWTDGRQYTPSRVRDEFLLYVVKEPDPPFSGNTSALDPAQAEAHRLIKQTYSVYIANTEPRRKWHITAYYTPYSLRHLGTVDDVPELRDVTVPEGLYIPARIVKHRSRPSDELQQLNTSAAAATSSSSFVSSSVSPSTSRRRGSDASSSEGIPQYAPYRPHSSHRSISHPTLSRSAPNYNTVAPYHPRSADIYTFPHPSGSMSAPSHRAPPSAYHGIDHLRLVPGRSHSMPQRPRTVRPATESSPPSRPMAGNDLILSHIIRDDEGEPDSEETPINMVPLGHLQQNHLRYYRDPMDEDTLRRFPPPNR